MIYTRIGKYGMIDAFRRYGRLKDDENYGNSGNFTIEAVEELFHYYDEMTGEHFELSQAYELDVIGICCEWTQWDNIDEVRQTYFYDAPETYDDDDVLEYLRDNTYHIVLSDDSILVREF